MPTRLITSTGVMATPDSDGSRGGGGGSHTTSSLSVSRSSLKISKSNLRRAVTQPRPAPQVYKTEPSDFRSLVQQLTGTSPITDVSPILTPKPLNPRLQKIAPPPLRPLFSYPLEQHQTQALPQHHQVQAQAPQAPFNPGPRRYPLTTLQRPSNLAVSPLSFSPLPALSPADQIWANIVAPLESPGSVAMRQLTQMMDASKQGLQPGMQQQQQQQQPLHHPQTLAHSNFSNFPHEFSRFSGASTGTRFSPVGLNTTSLNSTLNSSLNSSALNSSTLHPASTSPLSSTGFHHLGLGMPSSGFGAFGAGPLSPSASGAMDNAFSFPDFGDVSRMTFS